MRTSSKPDVVPLGNFAVSCGDLAAIGSRFEKLAQHAWFTRKISVLLPLGSVGTEIERVVAQLQVQKWHYELQDVQLAALGDQEFADAVRNRGICCLSQSRGLDADVVLGVFPPAELVASVDGATFEHLGVEEPAPGAQRLRKKLLPVGHRHLHLELGISKTRLKRAPAPGQAISRWRSLVPLEERCSFLACCNADDENGYDFAPLLVPGASVQRIPVPSTVRRVYLRSSSVRGDGSKVAAERPPLENLVHKDRWDEESYGEACEDLLDSIRAISRRGSIALESWGEHAGPPAGAPRSEMLHRCSSGWCTLVSALSLGRRRCTRFL